MAGLFEKVRRVTALVRSRLAMPLLAKELVEQAARKRTFVVRTIYALVFFSIALLMVWNLMERYERWGGGPYSFLGRGREIFSAIVGLQFGGIYLFLPAMMAGVITHEKERDSFTLLLLTDLRPWEILVQKFISRLIPMLSFLLLSMPLMAVAYAYGGVTADRLWLSIYLLLIACFQVGAVAVFCSSHARSTSAAFIFTYGLLAALYFTVPLACELLRWRLSESAAWAPFPFYWAAITADRAGVNTGQVMGDSIIIPISGFFFLVLARVVLVKRALVQPKNGLLVAFKWLDRFFQKLNNRFGNILLLKDRGSLPDAHPIAWREVTKRALGKARYLFRLVVFIEIPVLLAATAMIGSHAIGRRGQADEMSVVLLILWPVMALLVTVQAAGLFPSERARLSLDVLLTTPLSGREILREKMAAGRRVMWVMLIPFATIFFIEAWWESEHADLWRYGNANRLSVAGYLAMSFLNYFIYVPLCAWLGVFVSMSMRSQSRAIVAAVGALTAWLLGTMIFAAVIFPLFDLRVQQGWGLLLILLSPAVMVPLVEFDEFREFGGGAAVVAMVNYLWYGGIVLMLRSLCHSNADRWLGRSQGVAESQPGKAAPAPAPLSYASLDGKHDKESKPDE